MGQGLLSALGLPPRAGSKAAPPPTISITDVQGADVTDKGSRPIAIPVKPGDDVRKRLEGKEKVLLDAYAKLAAAQPKLEAAIAAANGDTRKAMEAQKAEVDQHLSSVQRQLKQVDADKRALDDPRTDAKAMNDLLARAKSNTVAGKAVEVDHHDSDLEKKRTQNRTTTTTTELKDGVSTTSVHDKTDAVGLGSAQRTTVSSVERQTADGKASTTVTETKGISKDGYSSETVVSREREVAGQKTTSEHKTGVSVGPGGFTKTDERKVTNADGTSTTTSAKTQLEREDGKLGVGRTTSTGSTEAECRESKTTTKTKGGLIAGKDGMGAYAEREKEYERKGKGGLTTGAVAGLNANVVCNVKVIDGKPPTYDLSISINLGVSVSLTAKKGRGEEATEKKGEGGGTVGASASGSMKVFMNRHYVLKEEEAQAYVASLKAASAGGGGGTQQEFAIIRTGVSKSWDAAREAYLAASGKALDPAELAKLRAGESVESGTKKTLGGGVDASAGGMGVSAGY